MPALSKHQSSSTTKLLFVGDSGCLSADTVVTVTRGNSKSKKKTILELFNLINNPHPNANTGLETFLTADLGGHAGLSRMLGVVQSGVKKTFQLKAGGNIIRATADHEFKTPSGWRRLGSLQKGDSVLSWRSSREVDIPSRFVKSSRPEDRRVVIYSIPYHPFAFKNIVAGRDYKRAHRARLVVEASMNGLSLEEFISVLRNAPEIACTLDYLPRDVDVHHLNGDYQDDSLENLQVLDRKVHIAEHQEQKCQRSKVIEPVVIESILECKQEMTYDIQMEGPHHNFIANGLVVHNSGKTGALASLAAAGYNLRILDLDNGLDVLKNLLTDPNSEYVKQNPSAAENVHYITVTDPMKQVGGKLMPVKATVWQRSVGLLQEWKDPEDESVNFGSILNWTSKEVLVIDSFTMLSNAALAFVLAMNGRIGQRPQLQDWGAGQSLLEDLVMMLYDENVRCNVIVNCHVKFLGEEGSAKGYVNTLGQALPPKIGRYFNSIIMAQTRGQGRAVSRKILTQPTGLIELKNTAPLRVKPEYDLQWGLAEYFNDVRGEGGSREDV